MPAKKKDPSTRRRRNKAASSATLKRPTLRSVDDFTDLTLVQLRDAIAELNLSRPEDQQIPARGRKAELVDRLVAAQSPVPAMPPHPPRFTEDGEQLEVEWHAQTVAWWNDVWTSPMAAEWDPSDVHNVTVVALLYDDIRSATSPKARKDALGEYRLQRADLGLSPYSRRRLEWTIEAADEARSNGERRRSTRPEGEKSAAKKTEPTVDPRAILAAVK